MIAYVESNFVLEIVLGQEQATGAEALLALAENGTIDLVIPSLSLAEPFATVTQRQRARRKLVNDLTAALRDLRRSAPYQSQAMLLESALTGLASIAGHESAMLDDVLRRVLAIARIVEFDSARFAQSLAYRPRYGLDAKDGLISASVVSDLARQSQADLKCFTTRNSKDFDAPDIVTELNGHNCRLFFSFDEAVRYCMP